MHSCCTLLPLYCEQEASRTSKLHLILTPCFLYSTLHWNHKLITKNKTEIMVMTTDKAGGAWKTRWQWPTCMCTRHIPQAKLLYCPCCSSQLLSACTYWTHNEVDRWVLWKRRWKDKGRQWISWGIKLPTQIHCRTVHLTLYWHFGMCSSKQSEGNTALSSTWRKRNFVWKKKVQITRLLFLIAWAIQYCWVTCWYRPLVM